MIGEVKPDVYFKGDEYKFERADVSGMIMKERQAVEELGGEIRYSRNLHLVPLTSPRKLS